MHKERAGKGAGKMAPGLSMPVVLADPPVLLPSTYMVLHNLLKLVLGI